MHSLVWFLAVVALNVATALKFDPYTPQEARKLYEQFKVKYNKNHQNEADEVRFQIFHDNLHRAQKQQAEDRGTAVYGVTEFSDLTLEEFLKMYTGAKPSMDIPKIDDSLLSDLPAPPEAVDWRDKNAVGPVEQQGNCGSCWAFATVGNIEGQWAIKTGQFTRLSKLQLVECDKKNYGCKGGWPETAMNSIIKFGGLESEESYPYSPDVGECRMDPKKFVAYINGTYQLYADEEQMKAWVAEKGPLSVALNAEYMQFYYGGLSHPPEGYCEVTKINHAVLIVGYGVERRKPFWIIKNTWGPNYGEQGYYRLFRGDGSCGVNLYGTTALIS